jgi:hypothetical protein
MVQILTGGTLDASPLKSRGMKKAVSIRQLLMVRLFCYLQGVEEKRGLPCEE